MPPSEKPITELDTFIRGWVDGKLNTSPLTDAERAEVIGAVRRCYGHARLPWPDRVVWVSSPTAGQRLAADLARRQTPIATRVRAVTATLWRAIGAVVGGLVGFGLPAVLYCAALALSLMCWLPGDPVVTRDSLDAWFIDMVPPQSGRVAWIGGILGGLLTMVGMETTRQVLDSREDRILESLGEILLVMWFGLLGIIGGLLVGLIAILVSPGTWTSPATWAWISTLLAATLVPTVVLYTLAGVAHRLDVARLEVRHTDPAHDMLVGRLDVALNVSRGRPAQDTRVYEGVDNRVYDAVGDSVVTVSQSIELALRSAVHRARIRWYPVGCFGAGHLYAQAHAGRARSVGLAWASWLVASGAPVPADAVAVVRDFVAASQAGWWWPHTSFVVISERPSVLRLDSGRLHSTNGPAAEWPDGFRIYALHGTVVPADRVEEGKRMRT